MKMYEYKYRHNFACVLAYTSCAIKYADSNRKIEQAIKFTTQAMVSLLLALPLTRFITKVGLH
jgi:hypothetical protein